MLQYLVNASMIWLSCLALYELLLRKESFHQWNRLFLVAALTGGLLLPLADAPQHLQASHENLILTRPVVQIYELAHGTNHTPPVPDERVKEDATPAWAVLLWAAYLAGVTLSLAFACKEAWQLCGIYRKGTRKRHQGYCLIETGEAHAPFSFFQNIFVSSRSNYSDSEWTMLLAHETAHGKRLHSLDVLMLTLLRSLFWFHPLVHLYYRRLRMIHEFEADQAAQSEGSGYGAFLVEQSMLAGVPGLTNPLYHSPLKTRIAMLTRARSARTRLLKYLAIVPLSAFFILCCTRSAISGEKGHPGNKRLHKGNEIVLGNFKVVPYEYRETLQRQRAMYLGAAIPDSVPMRNWATGESWMEPVRSEAVPVTLNGMPVLGSEERFCLSAEDLRYNKPMLKGRGKSLEEHLFLKLYAELNELPDGEYFLRINRLVVDDRGGIAYYEYDGLGRYVPPHQQVTDVPLDLRERIDRQATAILEGPVQFRPATKDGKAMNARLDMNSYEIIVKDHKAKLVARGGC